MSIDAPAKAAPGPSPPPLTAGGVRAGIVATLPLAPGIIMFGMAFGLLARQTGLGLAEAALMSLIVCAGTAQFAALQVWSDPAPVLAAGLASLTLNSRYVLLSAATRPWLAGLPAWKAYGVLVFLYDNNFALAAREQAAGRRDVGYLFGAGLTSAAIWTLSTMAGIVVGDRVGQAERLAIDFVLVAFFAGMFVSLWRGVGDVMPVIVAVVVAVIVERLAPGPWYMIAGAVAGSAVAALRVRDARA